VANAEAELAAAQSDAVVQARAALTAGRTVPAAGLGKHRQALEQAQDALLTAKAAAEQIEAQLADARKELASAQAKAETAATVTVGAEIGAPLVARLTELAAEFAGGLARLDWLVKHRAHWTPEMQALLALRDLPPLQWSVLAKTAPEVASALDRTVVALVNDPTATVP
jgi:hypothetical protein